MKSLPSSLWMVTGASVLKTPITAIINQSILSGKVPNSKTGFNINLYLFGFLLLKKSKNTCDVTLKIPLI
jgi:hypothetical protein